MAHTDSVTPEPRRFSIRLPRPLWIAMATFAVVVVTVGLRLGVPIYRQQVAVREIELLGGTVRTLPRGPEWLPVGCLQIAFNSHVVAPDFAVHHAFLA